MEELKCGVYEHWKGGRYFLLGVARDDRSEDLLVIYTRLYGRDGVPMSARPISDFLGEVDDGTGRSVPRFRHLGLSDSAD